VTGVFAAAASRSVIAAGISSSFSPRTRSTGQDTAGSFAMLSSRHPGASQPTNQPGNHEKGARCAARCRATSSILVETPIAISPATGRRLAKSTAAPPPTDQPAAMTGEAARSDRWRT